MRWLSLLVSAAAFGEETPEDLLSRGVALFEQGDLENAAFALETARRAGAADPRLRVCTWLYLGVVRSALNDSEGAREAFDLALAEDPNAGPLPRGAQPRAIQLFRELRAKHGLPAATAPPSEASAQADAPPEGDAPPPKEDRTRWPIWTAAGVTVVLLAAAVVTGAASRGAETDAREAGSVADAEESLDSARTRATAANVLFGLAGAGAAATVALWVW